MTVTSANPVAEQGSYYVLKCFDPPHFYKARVEYRDDDAFRFWNSGEPLENHPALPMRVPVATDRQTVMAEFWDATPALMTKRLLDALTAAGVNNLEVFPAVLIDSSGAETTNHVAFNLVGLIAAADLNATRFAPGTERRMIDSDIDHLVVDPSKTGGALMFRLAEAVNVILVHEKVKTAIEAAGIDTMTFMLPEDGAF
ncbi:imm11 family protein [Pyxidicoccus caerfyrddinensis]|uniref:imm11 family protein n=1 Tax=Pyxidicoccus caerfyrddinensis TaxID=2709663 RepID=UPI0013D96637|nr:DUF1629 domain-containing protein [Pyxidicoccus caerfyrddinensis]